MDRNIYRDCLSDLKIVMDTPNTHFAAFTKIVSLTALEVGIEPILFNLELKEHPYILTANLIKNCEAVFRTIMKAQFIEATNDLLPAKSQDVVEKHQELWQHVWTDHSDTELQELIDFRGLRFDVNDLPQEFVGKDCIDFGCGNGSITFAMLERGANSVVGIDFGKRNIERARNEATTRKANAKFRVGDILNTGLQSDSCEFAVCSAVLHHLRDEAAMETALREIARVMKLGTGFFVYVDGSHAISIDIQDTCSNILKEVPIPFIGNVLQGMQISRAKMVHLVDNFNATYIHTTPENFTEILSRCGFGEFRRLVSGHPTSWDLDKIESDPYGIEKFGTGELRYFCRKVKECA